MLFQGKKINCIITYKNKNYSFDLEKHKTVNDLYNAFTEKCPDKNYPFIIMLSSNKNLSEITNLDTTLLSLEKDKNEKLLFQFIKSFKCPTCLSNCDNENKIINKYCLNCNQYVCSTCSKQKDSKHNTHYLLNIDQNNLKDSIKLWNINLNAELSNIITFFNRQLSFVNEKDFEIKIKLWLDNIFKKIQYYQNLINDIRTRINEIQSIIKESENLLNKAMANLTRSEQEINTDIFGNDKIINKFFSFSEAEKQILKLKNNYNEINDVKSKISTIIDLNNIKKYEEILYDIPRSFDDLSKTAFLILEDLKIYEKKNKKSIKKESDINSRKVIDTLMNYKPLFKTSNDVVGSRIKNKNAYFAFDDGKKKTDLSVKIKDVMTFSNNNDEIYRRQNKKLTMIKKDNNKQKMMDRRKSSEIKLIKNNNRNETDSSRYTPKNLKLPKIIINDKEKRNNNFLSEYNDDIKRSMEIHKSSIISRKNYK